MSTITEYIFSGEFEKAQELLDDNDIWSDDEKIDKLLQALKRPNYWQDTNHNIDRKKVVHFFIDNNVDINSKTIDEKTALINAIKSNELEIVKLLVDNRANINMKANGSTPLIQAIITSRGSRRVRDITTSKSRMTRDITIVQYLLDNGADVNYGDSSGNTAIMIAIKEKYFDIVDLLLDYKADISLTNDNQETALVMFDFSFFGSIKDIIKKLKDMISKSIKIGMDINACDKDGMSILMKYANTSYSLTELLINNKANVNAQDNSGQSVLMYALKSTHKNRGIIPSIIQLLVDNGANIHHKTKEGKTALMLASYNHSYEVVEYLINKKVAIDEKDNSGETALFKVFSLGGWSTKEGTTEDKIIDTITLLLEAKANINVKNKNDETVFSLAVSRNLSMAMLLLIDYGIDISKENIDINELFVKSLFHDDNFKLADYLLDNSLNLDYTDEEGNTFLLQAIMYSTKNIEAIKYLVNKDNGKSINLQNKWGTSPLMYLVKKIDYKEHIKFYESYEKYSEQAIISYIVSKGADINMISTTDKLITPLTLAIINNREYTYKYLRSLKVDSSKALRYLLQNDLYFENEYFERKLEELLDDQIDYTTRMDLFQSWSYFDKRIDVDKIDKCIFLLKEFKIKPKIRIKNDIKGILDNCKRYPHKVEKRLKNNLHSITSKTFEDILREFIEFPNTAKELVKILTNFRKDTPIKYTTHLWDMNFNNDYGNFDGYMTKVTKQWEEIESELKSLSPNIHRKVYDFLINKSPNTNWCSKDGDEISIGWSSLDGLKEWCDSGNDPFKFELKKSYSVENKTISTFGDVINLFKQEIQIRNENDVLESIFIDIEERLDGEFDGIFEIETIKLKGKSFYTDVEKFKNVLDRIFSEIKKRKKFNKIIVEMKEYDDYNYMDLTITQIGSSANRTKEDMEKISIGGDMAEIKKSLRNLCDWRIETSYEDKFYYINYLGDINTKIETRGFTHILRFYR